MVKLNDFLYSGDTVLKIIYKYYDALCADYEKTGNVVDKAHAEFLLHFADLLEHNEFLTAQSVKIREFYHQLSMQYPYLSFIFKGRIKSLVRAEAKFNGYVVGSIYEYYIKNGTYPSPENLVNMLHVFRDLIAYRITISIPKCRKLENTTREEEEIRLLYEIAESLIVFMQENGFVPQISEEKYISDRLSENTRPYFRDYIAHPSPFGYQSLHVTFFDTHADCYIEMQLRTKAMDDYAVIGPANHSNYEDNQTKERNTRDAIPFGEYPYFDEAYERSCDLQNLDLAGLDVNMFTAYSNTLVNDACGLTRGRLILPYEHLSRFQIDSP